MGDLFAFSMNDFVDRRKSLSVSPRPQQYVGLDSESDCMAEDITKMLKSSCFRVANDQDSLTRFPGEFVTALNAGGSPVSSGGVQYSKDQFFSSGDVLRTDDDISGTSEPSLYQTARYGNVTYKFEDLQCGEYFVDLHFAEIVFTNGPSGMRVFDVHIQNEKVIAGLDVYAEVGTNKALIFCVKTIVFNGTLLVAFKGVIGNPIISAVCVRRSLHLGSRNVMQARAVAEEEPKAPKKIRKPAIEYGAKLEELKNECHEAWISLQEANRKIEKLQMEAISKSLTIDTLASTVESQDNEMAELREKANGGLQKWKIAVSNLSIEIQKVKSDYGVLAHETKDWIRSFPDSSALITSVQALVKEHEDLQRKYEEQSQERKQLYNEVLELQGNIRVFCRCRPLSSFEVTSGISGAVEFDAVKDNELIVRTGTSKKLFKFDRVFTPQDDQGVVFANTAPVVVSVLDGYNVCIFAYGQTGTGKTFTMEGTANNRGVNYRTLEELFRIAEDRQGQCNYEISVSVLEVYNEQIRDLLAPPPDPDQTVKKLEIRQLADGGHHVPGLVEAQVNCMEEVWEVLQTGSSARAVESTNANQHSSRSHCMLCVMVKGRNLITGECTRSKLWLVDLAGSERVAKTDVQGDRLKEAQSINKSLSALGDVIAALTTKSSHVPFRNSKLTHLLQDSLGGDSKTLMFVQISPSEDDAGESLCSLNFASRVRGVELGPARKQIDTSEIFKYKQLAERAKQEGRTKEEAVKRLEDNLRSTEVKFKVREHQYQALVDKMKDKEKSMADLEGQLAAEKKARLTAQSSLKDKDKEKSLGDLEGQLAAEKKARLAAQASLKEKTSQLEKAEKALKDARSVPAERRPLQEKTQEAAADGGRPLTKGGAAGGNLASSMSPVREIEHLSENVDPQQGEQFDIKAKVLPTRYYSPTIRRKLSRIPMRASIATTYQINPATLRESFSSDESNIDSSKENSRYSNDVPRERRISSFNRPPPPVVPAASALFGRKKVVHFASPVFQKEKARVEQKASKGDNEQQSNGGQLASSLDAVEAKKLAANKIRRVSIARRASSQFSQRTTGGAQRVLSSAGERLKSGVLPPTRPLQTERRWNK
ncbi:unnamed protein product [Calypogeia fissa]